jgi:FkbM family methyltransferase
MQEALYVQGSNDGRGSLRGELSKVTGTLEFSSYTGEPLDWWVENAYKILNRYDGGGKTFVDIGAHIGVVTVLAMLGGFEKGVAVEALPMNYQKLLINVDRHKLAGRVLPIWAAISNDPAITKRSLGYVPNSNSGTSSLAFGDGVLNTPVASLRLDNVYDIIGRPDFLKIDIEGGEWEILDQIDSEYLDLELHPKIGTYSVEDAKELLSAKYDLKDNPETPGVYGYRK